jgi:predicted outer membrane protein
MRYFRLILFAVCTLTFFTGAQKKVTMDDARIIEVIKAAGLSELDLARLAKNKSQNPSIEVFATRVIGEQSAELGQLHTLVKDKRMHFTESKLSKDLEMRGMARFDQLEVLKGKSFDKAYIDTVVAVYHSLQDEFDILLPKVVDADLATLLRKTKTETSKQLESALRIQQDYTQ